MGTLKSVIPISHVWDHFYKTENEDDIFLGLADSVQTKKIPNEVFVKH